MSANEDETGTPADDTGSADTAVAEEVAYKLTLDVKIEDDGPCKKRIRVIIPRDDITHFYTEAVGKLSGETEVPGFRKGHVPEKLIEKRFRTELTEEVKRTVLLQSLEQVTEENDLDPIDEPNIDVENIEIPEEGDFEYEFDVEVRPVFDLPDYSGLTIDRPVKTIDDDDIEKHLQRFLTQYGKLVPFDGAASAGDSVVVTAEFFHNDEPLHKMSELTVQLRDVLRFQDSELEGFCELMVGASAGDTRETDLTISAEAESIEMRGETVHVSFKVEDVKRTEIPELDKEFLERIGVETEEDLHKEVRSMLERRVTYEQRQSVRSQVLEKITDASDWELPEKMVRRQVDNALRREMLEMQQAGFTVQEIQARENELMQQAVTTTRRALKEHFVLDKIATQESLDVTPEEIDMEIQMMAMQRGESPRRVRAKLVKSGVIENLDAQIRERKAVDYIIGLAKFNDVEMDEPEEDRISAVAQTVCGLTVQADLESDSGDEEAGDDEAD